MRGRDAAGFGDPRHGAAAPGPGDRAAEPALRMGRVTASPRASTEIRRRRLREGARRRTGRFRRSAGRSASIPPRWADSVPNPALGQASNGASPQMTPPFRPQGRNPRPRRRGRRRWAWGLPPASGSRPRLPLRAALPGNRPGATGCPDTRASCRPSVSGPSGRIGRTMPRPGTSATGRVAGASWSRCGGLADLMDASEHDALAYMSFPRQHRDPGCTARMASTRPFFLAVPALPCAVDLVAKRGASAASVAGRPVEALPR